MLINLKKVLVIIAYLLSFILLFIYALPYFMNVNFFMDEGYYIGGALKVLQGDFFLTSYKSDKPFMINWSLLPGILLFGKNVIGYRFSSFLAGLISFYYLTKSFKGFLFKESKIVKVGIFLLILSFFLRDSTLNYLASAFTDSFLLMFLSIYFYYTLKYVESGSNKELKKSYIFWSLAFFTKFSAIMWAPLSLGALLFHKGKRINVIKEIIYVLKSSRWVWFLGFVFFATNRSKFLPVAWLFKNLSYSHSDQEKVGLFGRVLLWLNYPFMEYGMIGGIFIYGLLFSSIIFGLIKYKEKKLTRVHLIFILCFLLPVLLHFFGLPLSGAKFYKRYFFILTANVLNFIIGFVSLIQLKNRYQEMVLKTAIILTSIYCFLALPESSFRGIKNDVGHIGYFLKDEVPHENLYLNNEGNTWEMRPYLGDINYNQINSASIDKVEEVKVGQTEPYHHFVLKRKDDHNNELREVFPSLKNVVSKKLEIGDVKNDLLQKLLNKLKLKKFDVVSFTVDENIYDISGASLNSFNIKGAPFSIKLQRKKKNKGLAKKIFGENISINIKGALSINRGRLTKKEFGDRYSLGARLSEIKINDIDTNIVGIASVLYKGLFIPIMPVSIDNSDDIRVKRFSLKSSLQCEYIVYEN